MVQNKLLGAKHSKFLAKKSVEGWKLNFLEAV